MFRCTACGRRVDSPVVIGAGDCPHCGGNVVFDLHGDVPEHRNEPESPPHGRVGRRRGLFRRLLGR
jgi:DNA-directed RNA polymerase subunit RPC12/RpoP